MFHFVEGFRDVLYYQQVPGLIGVGYAVLAAVGTLVVGWWVFQRFEPRLAEEL
jgi:ABC-type polysaccharide/polyol phosphate export permease